MLLALIVWIGGIIFFAFVLAPTLFTVLPSAQLAGDVVSPTLTKLHRIGLVSGSIFLLASMMYNLKRYFAPRLFAVAHILIALMLALTAVSEFAITPRMRNLRAQLEIMRKPGYEAHTAGSAPSIIANGRGQFDKLHRWSRRLEGGVLVLGLVVVVLTARRNS